MDRRLSMLLIGLVCGGGIGFTIAAGNGVTFVGHDHATGHGGGGHDHSTITSTDLPASDTAQHLLHRYSKIQLRAGISRLRKPTLSSPLKTPARFI